MNLHSRPLRKDGLLFCEPWTSLAAGCVVSSTVDAMRISRTVTFDLITLGACNSHGVSRNSDSSQVLSLVSLTKRSPLPSFVTSVVLSPKVTLSSLWTLKGDLSDTFADPLELITVNFLNGDQPVMGEAPRALPVQGVFTLRDMERGHQSGEQRDGFSRYKSSREGLIKTSEFGSMGRDGSCYRDHGNERGVAGAKESRGMTYGRLMDWASAEDPGELALFMSSEISQIERFLTQDSIKEDWYSLFVSAIDKAITTQLQRAAISRILEVLCKTPFLDKHLTAFVLDKMTLEEWQDGKRFLGAMIRLLETMLKVLPTNTITVKIITAIPQLKQVSEFFLFNDLTAQVSELGIKAGQAYKAGKQISQSRLGLTSGELPPDDFVQASVLPTSDDIKEGQQIFMRPIVAEGSYDDANHYLDVQFRLMRYDFITPLREGIIEFKKSGLKKHFSSSDLRLYFDVHILGMIHIDGIDHVLQFDISKLKSVNWDFSKRLIFGSLVCISKDGFETMAIATVSNRDPKDLKKGYVNVNFRSGLDIVFSSTPDDEFVMAETVAYYESYCHVLEGLQEMREHLPLQDYIVSCKKAVKPPEYMLRESSSPVYDLHPLMKGNASVNVPVLITTKWPPSDKMSLNESQREAVKMALTKKLAVIQGPPGTGKTYVGLKVVHTLLENHSAWALTKTKLQGNSNPILIVCYTNHALDQFLEGILQFCKNGIIRVGGRSKTESLEPFNLKVIRNNLKTGRLLNNKSVSNSRNMCHKRLHGLIEQLERASKELEATAFAICSESKLSSYICEEHMESLRRGDGSGFKVKGSPLGHWLNARVEDPSVSVANLIEQSMKRLILRGDIQPLNQIIREQMPVQERAALYFFYVEILVENIFNTKPQDVFEAERLQEILVICQTDILEDNIIQLVMKPKVFVKIQNLLGKKKESFPNKNVKAWLLGSHKSLHAQLDDIEKLKMKAPTTDVGSSVEVEAEVDVKQQDATDDHFDDRIDEGYLEQTLALKNSIASIMKRVSALELEQLEQNSASDEGWQTVGKRWSFAKISRKINTTKPMTEVQEAFIQDIWTLNMKERFALYKLWVERYKAKLSDERRLLLDQYRYVLSEKEEINSQETVSILRGASIIGMTTTCAAKYRSVLQAVACKIIVVEEAAEVLEAHIVTALNKECEHLILIGDHQQLRPSPVVYELAKDFGLEISLFERLVKNNFPHVVLQEQHRMRPEISMIMRHIYPNLKDHSVVSSYDHIKGVSKDIFFVQHEEPESSVNDTHSKANEFEAKYVIKMCEYFLLQGYDPSQMTILTTYAGQVFAIKTLMKTLQFKASVRVTSVDNFQGEENDIIILSLVRSNENNKVGFLKVENRVCVALSRAKKGLFVIGNLELLSSQSKLWKKILYTASSCDIIGNGLPVVCQNHPEKEHALMFSPKDFDNRPEGGCGLPCKYVLPCGHICELTCHGYDRDHEKYKCNKPCTKSCIFGHRCQKKCFQDCGKCEVPVQKQIPSCGHKDSVPCHLPAENAICCQPCEKILDDCEHQCSGQCGHCKAISKHRLCEKLVHYMWPCRHLEQVKCHQKPDLFACPHPCEAVLECGHRCKGTCGHCLQGQVHKACGEICKKMLPCGHLCSNYCSAPCTPCKKPCPSKCRHRSCKDSQERCGHICIPCKEKCRRGCDCNKCDNFCSEICSIKLCNKPCKRDIKHCGHECSSLCGELCVCCVCTKIEKIHEHIGSDIDHDSVCTSLLKEVTAIEEGNEMVAGTHHDRDKKSTGACSMDRSIGKATNEENKQKSNVPQHCKSLLLKIPSCNHVFYVDELDQYMSNFDPGGSRYIPCPTCQLPIQNCKQYEHINIARAKRRNQLKQCLLDQNFCSVLDKRELAESQKVLENSELMASFKKIDTNAVKTKAEVQALSFKFKLAFTLCEIMSFELSADYNSEFPGIISTRKDALLRIAGHVTAQQKREFIIDLARCLVQAVVFKVKDLNYQAIQDVTSPQDDLLKECGATAKVEDQEEFVDWLDHKIKLFISSRKDALSSSDYCEALQLKLIERHVNNVWTVLRSDDSQFLCNILPLSASVKASKSNPTERKKESKFAVSSKIFVQKTPDKGRKAIAQSLREPSVSEGWLQSLSSRTSTTENPRRIRRMPIIEHND
ncbi:nfx1-type Zinc finger-containing protein 1-like [Plakobranchus ocellatus]|uniref:Nfx1-type Zinc finger-containing protein 1-like n=1 Tax=Plakobranchus ocellatus TaxID=259542 RepID=A0AAV3YZC5_9GAST|nr:nfx1-type Zinc finger-containing protein 1-like [Plakobranchus ocellatus]